MVHFFDGTVYLNDQPLQSRLGKFPCVPAGGELRTEHGRAEVLLTPGVFLRAGESTAIRMLSNALSDTQVELSAGSVIVDSGKPNQDTAVTLRVRNYNVHFPEEGVFRIDSDPPRVWALQGKAEVVALHGKEPVAVSEGNFLPLASVLVAEHSTQEPVDGLSDWNRGRRESIDADNAITAQINEDPANQTATGPDGYTYFPFLGVPSLASLPPGAYSYFNTYQPGFNSIYLPGYTYQPLLIGVMGRGYRLSVPPTRPGRGVLTGTGTGIGTYMPRPPIGRPLPSSPTYLGLPSRPTVPGGVTMAPRPVHGAPVHAPVHGGTSVVHAGGRGR
ncbi:MAG: hypothetical protein JO022_07330 [Acidobacteriaceae bacterium]|nr:hypothetical protein [Acidobacteriaceae bacterium]